MRKDLSVYLKIIKQSIDDFDDPEQARPAVEAITPAAERGNVQALYMLGMYYYRFHCGDSSRFLHLMVRAAESDNLKAIKFLADYYRFISDDMEPEQRKLLGRKWLYRMIDVLKKKADKGVVSAVKSLMNLYVHDRPDDMTEKEGLDAALMCYERLIEILRIKAEHGTAKDKKNLADTLSYELDAPLEIVSCLPDRTDEATRLYEEISGEKKDGASFVDLAQTYFIGLSELGESSLNFTLRFWVKLESGVLNAQCKVLESIKAQLDKNGIEIPYNKLDVNIIKAD